MSDFSWTLPSSDPPPSAAPAGAEESAHGYGQIPYGTGAYAAPFGISLENAWASSTHTVRVETTAPMFYGLGFESGSALRPATWTVTNLTTGAVYTVLGATQISPEAVDLLLLEALGPYQETHRVQSTTLRSASSLIISNPIAADFAGVVSAYAAPPSDVAVFRVRDLANPTIVDRSIGAGGTLVIGGSCDYTSEEGEALTRKLVIRRIITPLGGHRHLPTYGGGLVVKEPLPNRGSLSRLKIEIERQAELEPEVERASAAMTLDRDGIITVLLRLLLRQDGSEINLSLRVNPSVGSVVIL